jgi:hypothetical protein
MGVDRADAASSRRDIRFYSATVLAEAARVVRPGGSVAIFDGDYASLTFGCCDPSSARRWSARSSRRS